jgi:hypothetical protein
MPPNPRPFDATTAAKACGPSTFGLASCTKATLSHGCVHLENRDGCNTMLTQALIMALAAKLATMPDDTPPLTIWGAT